MPHTETRLTFVAFPKFLVAWPLILAGFFLPIFGAWWPTVFTPRLVCELWTVTFVFILITLGFDFNGLWMSIIVLLLTLAIVGSLLITSMYSIPILEVVRKTFETLTLELSKDMMVSVSIVLGTIFILMIVICFLNHRWVVSYGKIERIKFLLRESEELPISQSYPVNYIILDVMEYIVTLGAGHLRVKTGPHDYRLIGLVLFVRYMDIQIDKYETTVTTEHDSEDGHGSHH